MIKTLKFALVAAVTALSVASPALAQSFNPTYGSGNIGTVASTPGQSGMHAFAMVPRDPPAVMSINPEAAGGGSVGYNAHLLHD
jgi:hypothetical protein